MAYIERRAMVALAERDHRNASIDIVRKSRRMQLTEALPVSPAELPDQTYERLRREEAVRVVVFNRLFVFGLPPLEKPARQDDESNEQHNECYCCQESFHPLAPYLFQLTSRAVLLAGTPSGTLPLVSKT